ncbi:MAG TPA: Ig-like domain-containing protein [Methylomirabilota bacterium]
MITIGMHPRVATKSTMGAGVAVIVLAIALLTARPVGAQTPIPQLALWEANMRIYGQLACDYLGQPHTFDEYLSEVYYDAERVFEQVADYTGDGAWLTCAERAAAIYRDQYVMSASCWGGGAGCVPGYWNFTHGLTMDYLRTGDAASSDAVIALSEHAAYAVDTTPLDETVSAWRSREVAYAIMSYINAEKVGAAPRARLPELVDQALGHLDQWFVSRSFRCPSFCEPAEAAGQYYIQPFMLGLTAEALIMYADKTGDGRILPAITTALDWLWDNAWVAADQSFWYENWVSDPSIPFSAQPGAPDLNLLIAPAFAWVYQQTGDVTYRDRGDAVFAAGVLNAYLAGGKQFDQNYNWSFDYVKWRGAAVAPPPPPPLTAEITAPAAGARVNGTAAVVMAAGGGATPYTYTLDLDGVTLVSSGDATYMWNTTTAADTSHTLTLTVRDAAGASATAARSVNVANSPSGPWPYVTQPTNGATVSGTTSVVVWLKGLYDGANVYTVRVNGQVVATQTTSSKGPVSLPWDTTGTANGPQTISVEARDVVDDIGTTSVSVTVAN